MSELHGLWTTISIKLFKKNNDTENSLTVQWLGHCTFCNEGLGSIPGGKLRSQVVQCGQKKKGKPPPTKKPTNIGATCLMHSCVPAEMKEI